MSTQDDNIAEVRDRVKRHFADTPPERIVENTETVLREMGMGQENECTCDTTIEQVCPIHGATTSEPQCGHVPARPDVDLTLCWKCGVEIIPDPDTRLYRPLTASEKLVKREVTRQLHDLFYDVHVSEFQRVLFDRLELPQDIPCIRLAESIMGRWIVINGQSEDLAWSGSRWVPHRRGLPVDVQICNFATREEALAYAEEHFPSKPPE